MSAALLAKLSNLFGHEEHADCTVAFHVRNEEDSFHEGCEAVQPPNKRARTEESEAAAGCSSQQPSGLVGAPLPAHRLVLCCGSPRFAAQFERWIQEHVGQGGKPELRVPINHADDVPYARTPLQYMYTGELQLSSAEETCRVLRMALYLQVAGCVEACAAALSARVTATPLAGVAELYACRHLLPDPAEDGVAAVLLRGCRQQLVKSCSDGESLPEGSSPSLGELLAWSFGDAPSLLCDPDAKQQMLKLPAAGMEALLGSDSFGTDDEASVLLLLVSWMEANARGLNDASILALFRKVRLVQMNPTYLHSVLAFGFTSPNVFGSKGFLISRDEHTFLCQYAAEPDIHRVRLAMAAVGRYDCSSAWYSTVPRPRLRYDTGRPYEWFVEEKDVSAKLASPEANFGVPCNFSNGLQSLISRGLRWNLYLNFGKGSGNFGAYLACQSPLSNPVRVLGVVSTSARITVYRWCQDGRRKVAMSRVLTRDRIVDIGTAIRCDSKMPLACPLEAALSDGPGQGQLGVPALGPYLRDGRITGTWTWL